MPLNLLPEVAELYEIDPSQKARYIQLNGFGMVDLENVSLFLVRYYKEHGMLEMLRAKEVKETKPQKAVT